MVECILTLINSVFKFSCSDKEWISASCFTLIASIKAKASFVNPIYFQLNKLKLLYKNTNIKILYIPEFSEIFPVSFSTLV